MLQGAAESSKGDLKHGEAEEEGEGWQVGGAHSHCQVRLQMIIFIEFAEKPSIRAQSESEVFKVLKSGKTRRKGWKRMVTKVTFVGDNFTRKPPKFERFIRPMGLRMKKAHVTHPELRATFCLPIIGVKKNPSSPMYTNLGVITKGTVLEVNISELGLVTSGGKVVWGKYAQVTNNPENDGCINAVLLVNN